MTSERAAKLASFVGRHTAAWRQQVGMINIDNLKAAIVGLQNCDRTPQEEGLYNLLRIVENESYDWPELDNGIRHYVRILQLEGIETFQSCEGGPGHAYPEPTIEFYGGQDDGPRAVSIALKFGLPVVELRRTWEVRDGEMVGPQWAMTFRLTSDVWLKQAAERSAAPT